MRINTNVSALNAQRNLWGTQNAVSNSMQKLSSGFRINRSADDAAGFGIANSLRASLGSLKQAARNAEQATAMLQIADGATQTVSRILDRMKELATQAGSDTVDNAGRGRIKQEWDSLISEVGMISGTTKFQGTALLDGNFGNSIDADDTVSTALAAGTGLFEATLSGTAAATYSFTQAADGELTLDNGAGVTQTVAVVAGRQSVTFDKFGITVELDANFDETSAGGTLDGTDIVVDAGSSGGEFLVRSSGSYTSNDVISLSGLNLTTTALGLTNANIPLTGNGTVDQWQTAIGEIDDAIGLVNVELGEIGAAQNRIDFATQNVKTSIENVSAAESVIRDVDMAEEMATFSKNQILSQAGTAMLAQANQMGQGVLQLLRG